MYILYFVFCKKPCEDPQTVMLLWAVLKCELGFLTRAYVIVFVHEFMSDKVKINKYNVVVNSSLM